MKNPFVTNGYAGAEYFCDRAQETEILRELLVNENNIALISPRRIGKTDLIWHVFDDPGIQTKRTTIALWLTSMPLRIWAIL